MVQAADEIFMINTEWSREITTNFKPGYDFVHINDFFVFLFQPLFFLHKQHGMLQLKVLTEDMKGRRSLWRPTLAARNLRSPSSSRSTKVLLIMSSVGWMTAATSSL